MRKYEIYEAAAKNDRMLNSAFSFHFSELIFVRFAVQRLNELITTRGVDVKFINHNDNGKTVLHKAAELGRLLFSCVRKTSHERDVGERVAITFITRRTRRKCLLHSWVKVQRLFAVP